MSLRGVISINNEADANGGFDQFCADMKAAFSDLTNGAFRFPESPATKAGVKIEGIVQGEIKLGAVNDWKNTLFYGFSDASADVAPGGVHASSILKFATTYGNTLGYTLGGAGPASRKMYGGSNLQGFNVQFKWYTPIMGGWGDALTALTYLAWPSAVFDDQEGSTTPTPEQKKAETATDDSVRYDLMVSANAYLVANSEFKAKLSSAYAIKDHNESQKAIGALIMAKGFSTFGEVANIAFHSRGDDDEANMPLPYEVQSLLDNGRELAYEVMAINKSATRGSIKLLPAHIGNSIGTTTWVKCSKSDLQDDADGREIQADPSPTDTPGASKTSTTAKVFDVLTGTKMGSFASHLTSAMGDLVTALKQSIAHNPPKVKLEIFTCDGDLMYSFSPLVITSFAITGSRETVNITEEDPDTGVAPGIVPVVITIDIGFDYYLTNATGAPSTPKQLFAGRQIFGGLRS